MSSVFKKECKDFFSKTMIVANYIPSFLICIN